MGDQNLDKFKRRLIRSVARNISEKLPQDKLWANMKSYTGYDCRVLWQRMRALTIKKLSRLLPAGDYPENLAKVARMTEADWLMYDLILVHEPINVIGQDSNAQLLMELTELVIKFEVETEQPEALVHAWVLVTINYNRTGRHCSPMLLQRRWYQLKESTRQTFYTLWFKYYNNMNNCPVKPTDLQIKIAQCFPHVIVANFPEWRELVAKKMVVMPEDLEKVMNANGIYDDNAADQNTEPDVILLENNVETIDLGQDSDNEESERTNKSSDDQVPRLHKLSNHDSNEIHLATNIDGVNDAALKDIQHSNAINVEPDSIVTQDITTNEASTNTENNLQRVIKIEDNLIEPDSSKEVLESDTNIIGVMDSNVIEDSVQIHKVQGTDCNINDDSTEINNVQGTDCNVIDDTVEIPNVRGTNCIAIDDSLEINNVQGTDCTVVDHSTDLFISIPGNKSCDVLEEDSGLSNVMIIETTHIPQEIPITAVHSAMSEEKEIKSLSTKCEDSPTIKYEFVDKQPLGDICMSEIEFVDDGIEFIDDDDHAIINPKQETREESYTYSSDDDDRQQKLDPQLLMTPLVYTTKVDHMDILKDKNLANLNVNIILKDIIKQSKPEIHQLFKENLVTDDKIDIIAQSEQNEMITEDKNRIKLSSSLLKKPQCRTYNPIVLCKNPDFNTRLKRLPVGFFSFARNRQLLKACDPVTIDLHKSFEKKLINGTLYLKEVDDYEIQDKIENLGLPKMMDSQPTSVTPSALPAQSLIDKEYSVPKQNMPMHSQRSFDTHYGNMAYEAFGNVSNLAVNTQEKEILKTNARQHDPSENVSLKIKSVSSNVVVDKSDSLKSTIGGESATQMLQNVISENGSFEKTNSPFIVVSDNNENETFDKTTSQFNVVSNNNENGTLDKINSQFNVVSDNNENGTFDKTNSQFNVVSDINEKETFDKTNSQFNVVSDMSDKVNFQQQSTELKTGDGRIGVKIKPHPRHVNVPWFRKPIRVTKEHYEDVLLTIDTLNKMLKHLCKEDNFQQTIPTVKKSKQTECAPKAKEIALSLQESITEPIDGAPIIMEQVQVEENTIQESQNVMEAAPKINVVQNKRKQRSRKFCCWINRKMKKIESAQCGDKRRMRLTPHKCFKVSSICTCCCKEIYGSKIDEIQRTRRKNNNRVIMDSQDIPVMTTSNTTSLLNNEHSADTNTSNTTLLLNNEHSADANTSNTPLLLNNEHSADEITYTITPESTENTNVEQNMYKNCESIILSDEEPCNNDADNAAYSNNKILDNQNKAVQKIASIKIQSKKGKISIDGTSPLLRTVTLPNLNKDSKVQNANTQLFIIRPRSSNKRPLTLGKNRILLTTASIEDETNKYSCLKENVCLTTNTNQNFIASDANYVLPNGVQLLLLPNGQVTAIFEPNAEILPEDEMTKLQNLISNIQEQVLHSDLTKQIHTNINYSDLTCSNEVSDGREIDLTGSPIQLLPTDKSDNEGSIGCNDENEIADLTSGDKHNDRNEENNKVLERSTTEVDEISGVNVDSLQTIKEGLQKSDQIQKTDLSHDEALASGNIDNIQILDKTNVHEIKETNTEEQNKKTYLQIKQFANINKTSENIENAHCNSNEKKSILSDLMQLSGISTEDSKVIKVNDANSSNLINVDSSLTENSFHELSATNSVPELTPITSEKELKCALQNNGKFYTFNLNTGQIYSVKIHIKKKDKVLFSKFVNKKKITIDNNVIELGDSDDDKEISKAQSTDKTSHGNNKNLKKEVNIKTIVRYKCKSNVQRNFDKLLSKRNDVPDKNKKIKLSYLNQTSDDTIELVDSDENMERASFVGKAKIYGKRRKKISNFISTYTSDNNSSDEEPLAKKAKRKNAQPLHDANISDRLRSKENQEDNLSNKSNHIPGDVDLNTDIQCNFVDSVDEVDHYNIYSGPYMLGDPGEDDNSKEDCILGV